MNMDTLMELLNAVSQGELQVDQAALQLKHLAYEDIDFAHIDHHRSLRKGFPEVIFGEGKTAEQIEGIFARMTVHENTVLITRVDPPKAEFICKTHPQAVYHADARIARRWAMSKAVRTRTPRPKRQHAVLFCPVPPLPASPTPAAKAPRLLIVQEGAHRTHEIEPSTGPRG